jgi:hypothetical protein
MDNKPIYFQSRYETLRGANDKEVFYEARQIFANMTINVVCHTSVLSILAAYPQQEKQSLFHVVFYA